MGENIELLTFSQIAELAKKEICKDDKVSVGIWAKCNGYHRKRKMKDRKITTYYYKDAEEQEPEKICLIEIRKL